MHVVDWSIIHSGRGLQWCCIIVLVLYTHAELLWRIEGRGSYLHQPVWQAWLETQGSSQQSEELHRTDLSSIQWHMIDEGSDNTLTLRWKHPIFFFFKLKASFLLCIRSYTLSIAYAHCMALDWLSQVECETCFWPLSHGLPTKSCCLRTSTWGVVLNTCH